MKEMPHLLVVDDDREIRDLLSQFLGKNGFRVTTAANGREMKKALADWQIDLVVLDLMMPGEDGLTLTRDLRAKSDLPVIMLTAMGEETDRIIGLEMGADDYLAKPVDLRELASRIKAVLRRRVSVAASAEPAPERSRFRFGKTWLDLEAAKLLDEDGAEIPLTAMEFNLLKLFARNRGRVLNRDQILEGAHDRSWDPFDRSIDIRISRIRKKIELNPQKPEVIRTVRGVGYIYDPS